MRLASKMTSSIPVFRRSSKKQTNKQKHEEEHVQDYILFDRGPAPEKERINAKLHDGLCQHCKEVLEWRIKYSKYKPLSKPKKCSKKQTNKQKHEEEHVQDYILFDRGPAPEKERINAKLHDGLCQHCKEVLEWRIKYSKYKPLSKPKKCVKCLQKTVKDSYHTICRSCACELEVCAKCGKKEEIVIPISNKLEKIDNVK